MKKKLALLMAAIMTVAMVPMTAFASTKLIAVDEISTAVDKNFVSVTELVKDDKQVNIPGDDFEVILTLTNGVFSQDDDDNYEMENYTDVEGYTQMLVDKGYITGTVKASVDATIIDIDVVNDKTAYITLDAKTFNQDATGGAPANKACVLPIMAKASDTGDVVAKFTSNISQFKTASTVIATAYDEEVVVESEGVTTFVEDGTNMKNMKDITITGLVNNAIRNDDGTATITLKLKGNYEFWVREGGDGLGALYTVKNGALADLAMSDAVTLVNDSGSVYKFKDAGSTVTKDEIKLVFKDIDPNQETMIRISGIAIKPTKSCDPGDVAKLTISSKNFDSQKLEVAKMVEEAVTYTVEDDDLPKIWAGKDYGVNADKREDELNTLKLSVEENEGDILNTSRKATFTFPDGIEVVGVKIKGTPNIDSNGVITYTDTDDGNLEIDENVVTIKNYSKKAAESNKTDFDIEFILNAAPTFNGDVSVTLGGEFDDIDLKIATVEAPYTVEAKTTEVLIDYRYVPVNEIVITEAEDGILDDGDIVLLQVEKMDFEDAGSYEVTEGDIEVEVDIEDDNDNTAQLQITVKDASTEASTITISGLELYLDRTLPVGGYALQNVMTFDDGKPSADTSDNTNILWENSSNREGDADAKSVDFGYDYNGIFKYKALVCNDSYVEVVTQARDQDDSTTNRKIVITIGATTMAVGTETITLDTPAYINAENYTELPLRAVSEAFGATVNWDDASRTVTIMMGQRIVSMTIGSKTMYINGTPVAMNTAPEITNERTFVPVRDLANALGISKIDWNEASATVTLN